MAWLFIIVFGFFIVAMVVLLTLMWILIELGWLLGCCCPGGDVVDEGDGRARF